MPSACAPAAEFVRARGVRRVLSLLGDDEIAWYASDLDAAMRRDFSRYDRTSVFAPGARDVALAAFDAAREAGEPIVMHCSGGQGRAGIALSLWLVHCHGLTPEDAVAEVVVDVVQPTSAAAASNVPVGAIIDNVCGVSW